MKKIIISILILIAVKVNCQCITQSANCYSFKSIQMDSSFRLPTDTLKSAKVNSFAVKGEKLYLKTSTKWLGITSFTDTASYFKDGGNSYSHNATLGTNDNTALIFRTNGVDRIHLDAAGGFSSDYWSINQDGTAGFGDNGSGDPTFQIYPQGTLYNNGNYINFGTNFSHLGQDGFGIRDSAGIIQYKDSNNAWISLKNINTGSQWTTSGSDIYNNNAGYVGIGTNSPSAQLHVEGTSLFTLPNGNPNAFRIYDPYIDEDFIKIDNDDKRVIFNPSDNSNIRTIFNGTGGDYPVTIRGTGTNPLYGTIQLGLQSYDSETGVAFDNLGTGGRSHVMFSTNNSSGTGGGNWILADATSSKILLKFDDGQRFYLPNLANGVGNKQLRFNSSTGAVSYSDTTDLSDYLKASTASSTYFPLTGGSITGTGGNGYIGLIPQSSSPSTPGTGVVLYSRSTGAFSWKGTNGYQRSFVGTGITADRDYILPDASGTLLLNDNNATVTNKTIAASNNTITGLTNANLSGSAGITNANLANSAITIAGNSTSLGGSVTQDNITGLSSTGLIKRTGANTLAIATAGTDYQTALTNPVTGTGTSNQLAFFNGTTTIGSLSTSTYPSLTELSYVKGVTSAIQTQIDAKGTFTLPSLTSGSVLFSNGTTISQNNSNLFWDNTNTRLGIGNTTPSAALDITGATQSGATSVGILNLAQTWNNAGANPTAFKLNVTTTTTPTANALLMDLQQSSTSRFKVDYKGTTTITGTSSTQPAFTVTDNIGNTFKVGNGITNFNTLNPTSSSNVISFQSLKSSGNLFSFTSSNALDQTTSTNFLQLTPTYLSQSNAVNNTLLIAPVYTLNANSTSSSIQRGIYYNPAVTNLYSAKHYAIETVSGDVLFGTTSGNVGVGTSTPTARLHLAAGTATANTAPIKLTSGTNLSSVENGAIEYDGTSYYATAQGTRQNILKGVSGSYTGTGTATTSFTVTFGGTQPNSTYQVLVTPTNALTASVLYVTSKTTTTFTVTFLSGLTGTVAFDWALIQQ